MRRGAVSPQRHGSDTASQLQLDGVTTKPIQVGTGLLADPVERELDHQPCVYDQHVQQDSRLPAELNRRCVD